MIKATELGMCHAKGIVVVFHLSDRQTARLESLPCAADFSATHFKFQPQNFRKTTEGNNRTIV